MNVSLAGGVILAVLCVGSVVLPWGSFLGHSKRVAGVATPPAQPQSQARAVKPARAASATNPSQTAASTLPAPPANNFAAATRAETTPSLINFTHGRAESLSIRASNISWVNACADGKKVFEKLFEAGSVAEVRFSRQATLRSGNAGALELAAGANPIGLMGPWGAIRTIRTTPEGYEFITQSAAGCDIQ